MIKQKETQTPDELLQAAREAIQPWIVSENAPEVDRLDVVIEPVAIKECVSALVKAQWGYLSAITTLDHPEYMMAADSNEKTPIADEGKVELLYHFCNGAAVLTLRVTLPYEQAQVESICSVIPSATLFEREASELMGIDFVGTPSTQHLLLPDGWPEHVYPLRKAFTGLEKSKQVEER